ncbi:hypothetical protein HYX12_03435 [Candidatus Woesearchaeota archaeon]|nr:hypothetical protein [Candidatus Woesearchaeota archaeon]
MGKEKTPALEKHVSVNQPKKPSYFPKLRILFGLVIMVAALNEYYQWYPLPENTLEILLFIAGLWLVKLGIEWGFFQRRSHMFKKYI